MHDNHNIPSDDDEDDEGMPADNEYQTEIDSQNGLNRELEYISFIQPFRRALHDEECGKGKINKDGAKQMVTTTFSRSKIWRHPSQEF